jgi:hypothetical protein
MTDYIDRLKDAINRLHGCDSRHVESVAVREEFNGQTVWDGTVEVFTLIGHPSSWICYAWSHRNHDGSERYVAVLSRPPVSSPGAAVRAAIVAESKK